MKEASESIAAKPFFLETDSGSRFCIYYPHNPNTQCFGTFIYIHPMGEEMNKTRRMVALQAKAFSNIGYNVLQIDLFGCGDSSGEFREARWEKWKLDIKYAIEWVKAHTSSISINLWSLRLGALLALDSIHDLADDVEVQNIVLWQPILNGHTFITQFLRMQLVNKLLSNDSQEAKGVSELRSLLATGKTLEVAGYELAPELAAAIDNLKIDDLIILNSKIHWFDIVAGTSQSISASKIKILDQWKNKGSNIFMHPVIGSSFWASQEITVCSQLITDTTSLFNKTSAL